MNFKRWTSARRLVQLLVMALLASPLAGLAAFKGTLAAADIFGLPLADPLAALQAILASGVVVPAFILSSAAVTFCYFLLGGRVFCSWVCPVYLVTEIGEKLTKQSETGYSKLPLSTKQVLLLLALVATALSGVPFFETISPIGIASRVLAFGSWSGVMILAGVVTVEAVFARRVWCRSLCPLGGFYSIVGKYAPLKVGFDRGRCTACGECTRNCPVEEVLAPPLKGNMSYVSSGECTRCGLCIDVCKAKALQAAFNLSR